MIKIGEKFKVKASTTDAQFNELSFKAEAIQKLRSKEYVRVKMPPGYRNRFNDNETIWFVFGWGTCYLKTNMVESAYKGHNHALTSMFKN